LQENKNKLQIYQKQGEPLCSEIFILKISENKKFSGNFTLQVEL